MFTFFPIRRHGCFLTLQMGGIWALRGIDRTCPLQGMMVVPWNCRCPIQTNHVLGAVWWLISLSQPGLGWNKVDAPLSTDWVPKSIGTPWYIPFSTVTRINGVTNSERMMVKRDHDFFLPSNRVPLFFPSSNCHQVQVYIYQSPIVITWFSDDYHTIPR